MSVLATLREFHAQGIGAVRVDALRKLTGMTQDAIDSEVVRILRGRHAAKAGAYLHYAAPPVDCPDCDDEFYRKRCNTCSEWKLGENFYPCNSAKDGLKGQCKACMLAAQREARRGRPRADAKRTCPCCRKTKPSFHFAAVDPKAGRHAGKRWACLECDARKRREREVLEAGASATCGVWP